MAPSSCRSWFDAFCSAPADHVHHVGERDEDEPAVLNLLSGVGPARFVFHASHRSLGRDLRLARTLEQQGNAVLGPGPRAVSMGLDKVAMKEWFANAGIATPAGPVPGPGPWVVKRRYGTEGVGMSLVVGDAPLVDEQHYVETFVEGEECSVIVFRDDARFAVLPPVWKGQSNTDLLPPYRRMRVCPGPAGQHALEEQMVRISLEISAGVPCDGWLEVEFVVDPCGSPLVLEINPRVSGTMRLAAMAAEIPIFDIASDTSISGRLQATAYGIEVPWDGPTVTLPERQLFATSRLTVARPTRAEAVAELHRAFDEHLTPGTAGLPEASALL